MSVFRLKRYKNNPVISPKAENAWESLVATNPGAWYDEETHEVKLLYRAAGNDPEHIVRFGLAISKNGYDFERVSDQPVFGPSTDGFDAGCVEDPRIVKMGDYYFITYATRYAPPGQYWLRDKSYSAPPLPTEFPHFLRTNSTLTGLAITKDFHSYTRAGSITSTLLDDRDVVLFPEKINDRYVRLHRPMDWVGAEYGTEHPAIWISFSNDLMEWSESKLLLKAREDWECKIGANAPPVRTDKGWLALYHGMGPDGYYRLGAVLLDLDEPWKVTHRTKEWILQPKETYETIGCYAGGGVVFPCGNVIINNTFFVYYGGADKYVGVATCGLDEILDCLLAQPC